MNKSYWNIWIPILINFGYSQKITAEENETFHAELNETFYDESNGTFDDDFSETFYAELNKPSENLTAIGYEITHFNDTIIQV